MVEQIFYLFELFSHTFTRQGLGEGLLPYHQVLKRNLHINN